MRKGRPADASGFAPVRRRQGGIACAATCAAVLAVGCSDPQERPTGAFDPEVSPSIVLTEPSFQAAYFPGERQFVSLAARQPAFAGYHVEDGTLVASVADPAKEAAVREELLVGMSDIRGYRRPLPVVTRSVSYSFLQLANWRNLAARLVHFVSIDLDERMNRVVVGVRERGDESEARRILEQMGVPNDALVFELAAPLQPGVLRRPRNEVDARVPAVRRTHHISHRSDRPVPAGFRITMSEDDEFRLCQRVCG